MGRLWQTRLQAEWNALFLSLPLESVIRDNQQGYYAALEASDRRGDCTDFITFMLDVIADTLMENAPENALVSAPVNIEGMKTTDAVMVCIQQDKTITRQQMAEFIGKDLRTIGRAIKKLKELGCLKRVGSDKAGYWELNE